jgi:hypothetical protein
MGVGAPLGAMDPTTRDVHMLRLATSLCGAHYPLIIFCFLIVWSPDFMDYCLRKYVPAAAPEGSVLAYMLSLTFTSS